MISGGKGEKRTKGPWNFRGRTLFRTGREGGKAEQFGEAPFGLEISQKRMEQAWQVKAAGITASWILKNSANGTG